MNGHMRKTSRHSAKKEIPRSEIDQLSSNASDDPHHGVPANPTNEKRVNDVAKTPAEKQKVALAVAHATVPEWLNTAAMVGLIFGGCCANVFALEAIVKEAPSSGTLITFTQFILTSTFTLSSHLDISRGFQHLYLKPRAIPLSKWIQYTGFFLAINVLNNKAFDYKISVPLHIILRSAGPVSTMAVGYCAGKRYKRRQVLAVTLLFFGVVQAAIADAKAKGASVSVLGANGRSTTEFLIGSGILFLALMLSAMMGVFTDAMYAKYGRDHWIENLFYSHTLSLPFFLALLPELSAQSRNLWVSPALTISMSETVQLGTPSWVHAIMARTPIQLAFLLMNAVTQYFCIRGVNLLSARSSSLTVTIVLNIRKLVSLLLSIWLFGNRLAPGVAVGAVIVFLGGGLYAWPSPKRKPPINQ